jgi:hypothetical protein
MGNLQPEARAARRRQLETAVARVLSARDEAEAAADAAPVSGYRMAGSNEVAVVAPQPELRAAAPLLIVRAPEAVSHLQRARPLLPEADAELAARPIAAPSSALTSPSVALAPRSSATALGPQRALPRPLAPAAKARRRGMPWASSMLLAAALAAALLVLREGGEGGEPHGSAPLGGERHAAARLEPASAAPDPSPAGASRAPAAPSISPALASRVAASPASEPSPRRTRDVAQPKPAGGPARTAPAPGIDAAQNRTQRSAAREPLAGSASPGHAAAPAAAAGYLTLDTTPWSTVTLAGTSLGQTPLVKVELPAGQHLLELANEELGISTSMLVEITSGATTVRRIGLERPIHAARQ